MHDFINIIMTVTAVNTHTQVLLVRAHGLNIHIAQRSQWCAGKQRLRETTFLGLLLSANIASNNLLLLCERINIQLSHLQIFIHNSALYKNSLFNK